MDAAASPPAATKRAPAKRGARACVQCRKLKKTCEPDPSGSLSCTRCLSSGSECVYDRPASSVVDDAGLNRLSAIEATLSTQERRLDTLVSSVGEISTTLAEIMSYLRSGGSPASIPPQQTLSHHQPPILPTHASPQYAHLSPAPNPPALPSFGASILNPSASGRDDTSSPRSSTSRLEALATLASQPSPDGHVDRFASRLHAPIQALADAADEVQNREVSGSGEKGDSEGNGTEERPKKRSRIGMGAAFSVSPSAKQFDVVAKGIVSDRDARALVLLWLKELQPFCSILDPLTETYTTLRRNRFLFDVIIHTALRAQGGPAPASKELIAVAEQTRSAAQQLIFDAAPPIEVIQALLVMACYHDEPYLISGYAMRLALAARMDTIFEQIDEHGWDKTDERAKHLTLQLRVWLYLIFLEFKHSRSTGRLILLRQDDVDFVEQNADKLLTLHHSIADDQRTVANLKLTFIERQIILTSRRFKDRDDDMANRVAYVHQMRDVLVARHNFYDSRLAVKHPSPLSWARRSQLRHHSESIMFLSANVFGELLLEPNSQPEVQQIAQDTLIAARSVVRTVLQSPAYTSSVKFCGFLFKVDLSFAALLTLKLAKLFPHAVDSADVVADVDHLADLFADTSGSQRYAATLRFTRDQYLASIQTPSSSSALILPPSKPEESFAYEEGQLPPWFAPQHLDINGAGGRGTGALLPGEMEIDWNNVPTSFFSTDQMMGGNEWMGTGFPDMSWLGAM